MNLEEIKWAQKSREAWTQLGGKNNQFFFFKQWHSIDGGKIEYGKLEILKRYGLIIEKILWVFLSMIYQKDLSLITKGWF